MELRMLSGLHRGAALEVEPGTVAIGASGSAEILVADPGVAPVHARVTREGPLVQLVPAEGPVFDAQGRPIVAAAEVQRGSLFRLGAVWIGFFDEADPWLDALPAAFATASSADAATPGPEGAGWQRWQRTLARWQDAAQQLALRLPLPADRRVRWTLGFLAGLAIIGAAAAVVASRVVSDEAPQRQAKVGARPPPPAASSASPPAPPPGPALPPQELAKMFTRQLADRSLLEKLDVDYGAAAWTVKGSLDDEEQARLDRMVKAFERKFVLPVPVRVTIVPWSELLPFRLVQVTSGKGANVVLDSGQRVFVGEAVKEWRLVAIEPGKVVFDGKRRVEVAW